MNEFYKVGIYLSLSNEDKDKKNYYEQSESIKNQRNMLIDYINKHPNFILEKEYCDEDISGAGTYRPQFEKLIKDCENHLIDIVLCKSQSRFSRDMEIVEKYLNNKFKEWNIRFIGLSDNADTLVLGNKKSRQINGLVNEWYLEDVSNNIRSAFKTKMQQGEFISPFASYGYTISKSNKNKLIIDPIAARNVKYIYNLYLKGYGFSKIANTLNKQKIPSPSYYKFQQGIKLNINSKKKPNEILWNPNSIKRILTNEIYIGNLIQGKRTTVSYKNHKIINNSKEKWISKENTHENIIDDNTFLKVNNLLKTKTKPTKNGSIHLFSNKVYCYKCKNKMHKKNSTKYSYLICNNSKCQNKSIRYDELKDIILNKINNLLTKYYNYSLLLKLQSNNNQNTLKTNELNTIKIKLNKIDLYIKNLYEDKINSIITTENFIYLLNEYNHEKKILEKRQYQINKDSKNNNKIKNKYKKFNKLDKIILDEFINNIYIDDIENDFRNIYIEWNF